MSDDETRVMAQIDGYAARETRREQTARWNDAPPPITRERVLGMYADIAASFPPVTCPRCSRMGVGRVCDFCGKDRSDPLVPDITPSKCVRCGEVHDASARGLALCQAAIACHDYDHHAVGWRSEASRRLQQDYQQAYIAYVTGDAA